MSNPTPGAGRRPSVLRLLLVTLIATGLLACSGEDAPDAASPNPDTSSASTLADAEDASGGGVDRTAGRVEKASVEKGRKAARHPSERPVPAFSGVTLAGTRLAMRDLLGSRVMLFFFNPEVDQAMPVGHAVSALAEVSDDHNFRVVGIGVGSNGGTLSRFVERAGFGFPVIDDSGGTISGQLRLRAPVAILGVDAEGYMTFGLAGFPTEGDVAAIVEDQLREQMRLPEAPDGEAGALYAWPDAPELGVIAMSDGEVLETSDLEGRAAIVIFFLHTCPHCHKALEAIQDILARMPEEKQPRLVAVSIQNAPAGIRSALKDLGLDYFDPYLDPGGQATDRWGVTGGVPVVHVLDPEGRIVHRSQGWDEKRHGGLLRMRVAQAAGAQVPMLLDPTGYSGNDVCGTCHQQEYATWQYTSHATAFDTLVTHAADRRTDCVGCHVVGFEEKGGWDFVRRPGHLENVGCESCHGRGGPHLSPGFVPPGESAEERYATVCGTCHNPTHSLGFEFGTFHPRVSHTRLASLSNAERAELLEGGGPSRQLLPTSADYVGSDACRSCHAKEYETWSASPHGHAVETLQAKGKADDADCLQCHTTAYGKPGGFPTEAPVAAHPDLARVGCESCHGPGGDHVGENAKRVGTILSLGDKCDSCVILKVCGTCHDDANDPGFEFHVEERIEAQRHGTIESAATREGRSAFHDTGTHDTGTHDTGTHGGLAERGGAGAHDRARLHLAFEALAPPGEHDSQRTVADASQRTVADASQRTVADASQRTVADASQRTVADASQRTVADASRRTVADAAPDAG